ncbi:MAG: COX15/CtaA family protein [Pseudomonadota bacterium]
MSQSLAPDTFGLPKSAGATAQPRRGAQDLRPVVWWLFAMCALIALMVSVGGATRLTDSGLSITEWKPIVGAIPPLSQETWLAEFEKYKQIPEYAEVNAGMSLGAFKEIYWWEWGHRFLGRVIGLAFAIPFLVFVVTDRVRGALRWQLLGLFLLGGAQGALGWYMVKSGLTERVDVSQYRLAAHLGLAIALFALMLTRALTLRRTYTARVSDAAPPFGRKSTLARAWVFAGLLTGGIYLQIILGAFVAGLRAGYSYNTWPLMGGRFFPEAYFDGAPRFAALFETFAAVQFNHRMMAYLLFAAALVFAWRLRKTAMGKPALIFASFVSAQGLLGIITLLTYTPIGLGLAHQLGALLVLSTGIWMTERAYFFSQFVRLQGVTGARSSSMSTMGGTMTPEPAG